MNVLFANIIQQPLAEELIELFGRAGWQTGLTKVPSESWQRKYIGGTIVRGCNKILTKKTGRLIRLYGLKDITTKIYNPSFGKTTQGGIGLSILSRLLSGIKQPDGKHRCWNSGTPYRNVTTCGRRTNTEEKQRWHHL